MGPGESSRGACPVGMRDKTLAFLESESFPASSPGPSKKEFVQQRRVGLE